MVEIASGGELAKVMHYYGMLEGESEFKIVCPFHQDVNASMKINVVDNSFFCFGCNVSGDALKFVLLMNKSLGELEACKKYYKILRSKKVRAIKIKHRVKNKIENAQALDEAHDYYFGLKTIDWKEQTTALKYMQGRGFTSASLKKCKAKVNDCSKNYPLIFPMFDNDEFKGWVCRTMDKQIEKKRKYLYNKGFSRANTLVGKYAGKKVVVIVEGYMDRLKMLQNGCKNVVAILGWKMTDQQIKKLKANGTTTIISALDNDVCGIKGTKYLEGFFKVTRFQFPEGVKDPGDMNREQFRRAKTKTLGGKNS